jgi:flavin-dependent dehydrogenase
LASGVELRFEKGDEPSREATIRAHGPRGCDAMAVGYVFETCMSDGVYGVLSDELAPKGYAYLLVNRGRGTIAACLFDGFAEERRYLDRTVDFFDRKVGLRMENPRRFGGTGQISLTRSACRGGVLLAGEAAGFQDALWGFGIRYALLSGYLAARAVLSGVDYDCLWKRRFGGLQRASVVNRYFFARMGHPAIGGSRALRRAPIRATGSAATTLLSLEVALGAGGAPRQLDALKARLAAACAVAFVAAVLAARDSRSA